MKRNDGMVHCHMPPVQPPPDPKVWYATFQKTPFGSIMLLSPADRRTLFSHFTARRLAEAMPNVGYAHPFFVGIEADKAAVEAEMKPVDQAVMDAAQAEIVAKAAALGLKPPTP